MNKGPEICGGRSWSVSVGLRWAALAALLGLPWFVIESKATVSVFLKLDNLKGESTVPGHEDEIEMLSMYFAANNSSTVLAPDGTSTVQDVNLVKYTDKVTPELMLRLLNGKSFREAQISFVETINTKEVPVVTFRLKDILVTSHSTGGEPAQNRLTENVGLNFREFTFQTFSYNPLGSQTANPSMTWDIATNTGSLAGAVNTAPTITSIAPQSISEDSAITIPFTVGDGETATGTLALSFSTSHPLVIPFSGISLGGSGSSRNVTITPTANASGSSTVAITVTDAGGLKTTQSFLVTVSAVNDPPIIPAIGPQITDFGILLALPLNISDIDTAARSVTVSATSGNPSLIPAANITSSGTGADRVLTLTPMAGVSGSSVITLTANDGAANSAPVSFTFTVNPAGFNGPTNIQWSGTVPLIPEDSATNTAVGTLVTTDPNDGNNVTYTLLDSASGRFKLGTLGTILVDNDLLLDFENSASHQITVRATDPAQNIYDKALSISISNVNEAPVISVSPSVNFLADSTNPVIGITLVDPDAGTADISLTFGIPSGILHLDATGPLAGKVSGNNTNSVTVTASTTAINTALNSGSLTYVGTSVPPGSYSLSIVANDLGNTGPGGPQSSSASLEINIVPSQFNQWRQEYFNSQLGDLSISGPLADPDQDGVANLLEYGVGSSPNEPTEGPGLVEFIQVEAAGVLYPAVRFKRLNLDFEPSLEIQLEIATDAFNWRIDPNDVALVSTTPLDEIRDTVVVRSKIPLNGEARQMMRLRFTLAP